MDSGIETSMEVPEAPASIENPPGFVENEVSRIEQRISEQIPQPTQRIMKKTPRSEIETGNDADSPSKHRRTEAPESAMDGSVPSAEQQYFTSVEDATADIDTSEAKHFVFFSELLGLGAGSMVDVFLAQKEISFKSHPHLMKEIKDAIKKEWSTVLEEKQAIRVLTPVQAKSVRQQPNPRIIPTRMVVIIKKDDDGNDIVKARWVMLGFRDPDAAKLASTNSRASPTITQNARMVTLQLLASMKWRMQLGDIKGAFMESDPLDREDGPPLRFHAKRWSWH